MADAFPLPIVDGLELEAPFRTALRAGELVRDDDGRTLELPRWFFRVDSWETALRTPLSPHFNVFEFLDVDVQEAEPLRAFPRFLPCAVVAFAAALERFREAVNAPVRIAANGGYRSPSHKLSAPASPHLWGSAADIYKIGGDYLDDAERIRKYGEIAVRTIPGAWIRPAGDGPGEAFDHLHVELGRLTLVPRSTNGAGEEASS